MNKLLLIILGLCLNAVAYATAGQAYLDKFMTYLHWHQNIPTNPDAEFLAFVDDTTPLSQKLREKWLYQLAYSKNWTTFIQHYKETPDLTLQCYEQTALYQQGQKQQALQAAQRLWLTGQSQPQTCDNLFALLLKNHDFDEKLIDQRLVLALEEHNLPLATYLLKQYTPPHLADALLLTAIHQNPRRITQLKPSQLHNEFYLYGLKQLVAIDMEQAIQYWQLGKTKQQLNHAQQQSFLMHLALYKAMRNHEDAPEWFAKVDPAFYNDALLGWQIRYALKYRKWREVERLINTLRNKEEPCWQYWLARALDAQGQPENAVEIYKKLAQVRHYYGFLASLRLKKNMSFSNEKAVSNINTLSTYQPVTDQIKNLYVTKQTLQASRLLNDFVSELPKQDKSALIYWLSHELQWHGKSVFLSNTNELNNQLSLRFPLAYHHTVATYAQNYQVPTELIYAIIRQESAFRDDATSTAGAQGLMQLMPATAKQVSKRANIAYGDKKQLFSSQKNINIGVAYLQQLAKRFDQNPVLIIAAYNAGPTQVVYWLKNHPPKEIDIWIETLPWQETRNYLKNVIAFYAVYQYRLQQKPDLSPFMRPLMGNGS